MFVDFNSLPDSARVWFFQADRPLTGEEKQEADDYLNAAIQKWVTHGMPMKGSFSLIHDRVVLIAADVDFQDPSGCSIDSSTRWLKDLGDALNLNFFDRSIGYFKDDRLEFFPLFEGKKYIVSGEITENTKMINHQVGSIGEFKESFYIRAADSFLKRHFPLPERI